jgi:hypothetical protein
VSLVFSQPCATREEALSAEQFTPASLANNLPITEVVSQNEGSTVLKRSDQYFISLDGKSWAPHSRAYR